MAALAICVCVSLSVYPSIYLSVCLSIYLSICQSIFLSIYLFIYLSVYISFYLSVFLSTGVSWFIKARHSQYLSHNYLSIHHYFFIVYLQINSFFISSIGLIGNAWWSATATATTTTTTTTTTANTTAANTTTTLKNWRLKGDRCWPPLQLEGLVPCERTRLPLYLEWRRRPGAVQWQQWLVPLHSGWQIGNHVLQRQSRGGIWQLRLVHWLNLVQWYCVVDTTKSRPRLCIKLKVPLIKY